MEVIPPPCWLSDVFDRDRNAEVGTWDRTTKLARYPDKQKHWWQGKETRVYDRSQQTCPWYIKVLVPPCWILDVMNREPDQPVDNHGIR